MSSWRVLKRREVEVSVAGEVPHGICPARGEGMGQACPNFSSALCFSSMSGASKCWHTSALTSVLLRDAQHRLFINVPYASLSFPFLPKEHCCPGSTDLFPLDDSLNGQDLHSSHLTKGAKGWNCLLGIWGKLGFLCKLAMVSSLERSHCTCDTWNLGFTWLTLPWRLMEFRYFCVISSLWSLSASSQSLLLKQKVIK